MPSLRRSLLIAIALLFHWTPHCQAFDLKSLNKLHTSILDDDIPAAQRALKTDPTLINAVQDTKFRKPSATDGFTPLHYAIYFEKPKVAEFLIDNGADINAPVSNTKSRTPLRLAAENGNEAIVKLLLDHKADLIAKAVFPDITPLDEALLRNHPKAAQLLISKSAPIDFFAAVALGRTDYLARELQRDPTLARAGEKTASPLHFAVAGNQKAVADLLLKSGADINAPAPELGQRSPLHLAVLHNQSDLVTFLLANKASPLVVDSYNETPLHIASTAPIADVLLKAGADANATDVAGYAPLHHAVERGLPDVIKVLLANKADINAPVKPAMLPGMPAGNSHFQHATDNTPLHIAAMTGQTQIVQLLASSGADLAARNSAGLTPLGLALRFQHDSTAELLKRLGAAE